jgi:hypothetical protein
MCEIEEDVSFWGERRIFCHTHLTCVINPNPEQERLFLEKHPEDEPKEGIDSNASL